MYTKPRNMRTASRNFTRGFNDHSEQVIINLPFMVTLVRNPPEYENCVTQFYPGF